MEKSVQLARHLDSVTTAFVADRVIGFLKDLHPMNTAKQVCRDTQGALPIRTIDKWLERVSSPNARAYTVLWCTYGPEFLAYIAPTRFAWLDANVRAARQDKINAEIARLMAEREALQ